MGVYTQLPDHITEVDVIIAGGKSSPQIYITIVFDSVVDLVTN